MCVLLHRFSGRRVVWVTQSEALGEVVDCGSISKQYNSTKSPQPRVLINEGS